MISIVTAGAANQNRPKKVVTILDFAYTARTLVRKRKDVEQVVTMLVTIINSQTA